MHRLESSALVKQAVALFICCALTHGANFQVATVEWYTPGREWARKAHQYVSGLEGKRFDSSVQNKITPQQGEQQVRYIAGMGLGGLGKFRGRAERCLGRTGRVYSVKLSLSS